MPGTSKSYGRPSTKNAPTKAVGVTSIQRKSPVPVASALYRSGDVDAFINWFHSATPGETVEIERRGVPGIMVKELARELDLSATRLYVILGVAKATVEKKASAGEQIDGAGGFAALGLVKLLGKVRDMVEDSPAKEAKDFDASRWLGEWIEKSQPALGGKKPAELLDTPTGFEMVSNVLGAIQSGAYL